VLTGIFWDCAFWCDDRLDLALDLELGPVLRAGLKLGYLHHSVPDDVSVIHNCLWGLTDFLTCSDPQLPTRVVMMTMMTMTLPTRVVTLPAAKEEAVMMMMTMMMTTAFYPLRPSLTPDLLAPDLLAAPTAMVEAEMRLALVLAATKDLF